MDVSRVRRKYRWKAGIYDLLVRRLTVRLRERAIAWLELAPGASVLDFGCGTGLSFELLHAAVGEHGRIIGVDVSPEMLARAREKVRRAGATNVTVMEANAEEVVLEPRSLDGILCFYTHDIMRCRPALGRAVAALRPGGRFVAAGAKLAAGPSGAVVNPVTVAYSRTAITDLTGFDRPWTVLEQVIGTLDVETHLWDTAYLARGVKHAT